VKEKIFSFTTSIFSFAEDIFSLENMMLSGIDKILCLSLNMLA